jgi:very-short-patch-repair endonuclease
MANYRSIELAREFRRVLTPQEQKLWNSLRNRGLAGLKFRRQHPMSGAIPDFYCAEARLIVEADGGVHLDIDRKEYDRVRDAWLAETGYIIVRFTNDEIDRSLASVMARIRTVAKERIQEAERLATKPLSIADGEGRPKGGVR